MRNIKQLNLFINVNILVVLKRAEIANLRKSVETSVKNPNRHKRAVKSWNFVQILKWLSKSKTWPKWKIWSKIENLVIIEISVKMENFVKNWNFGQKSKYRPKVQILVRNLNVCQNYKYWPEIQILTKNLNLGQKLKFWWKI